MLLFHNVQTTNFDLIQYMRYTVGALNMIFSATKSNCLAQY